MPFFRFRSRAGNARGINLSCHACCDVCDALTDCAPSEGRYPTQVDTQRCWTWLLASCRCSTTPQYTKHRVHKLELQRGLRYTRGHTRPCSRLYMCLWPTMSTTFVIRPGFCSSCARAFAVQETYRNVDGSPVRAW